MVKRSTQTPIVWSQAAGMDVAFSEKHGPLGQGLIQFNSTV
jgi:hypothetical protein